MTSIFSLDDITKEYVTRSPIAYLFGFGFIIPRFIEDQEAFNTSKDEKLDDTARIEALIKSGPEVLEAMQMSLDFLGFYKELGTFDIIENLLSQ